ncbi:diaminopimelate epimerase [Sarcina sp. DSM 11001]|uniref:diaminopimelate epimerase n=1 Tax=Sarcina sp. DSM 11001 TaxID=1798184 RepID=UPI00088E430F|nr:diaminopimelate epimerase [Sarcina sp. DSM 11001]SDL56171.1 diaminopimelate epimerase [Sarcina sp. DSM 11001]
MKIHFTKMHGCGNDYVYISGFDHRIDPETKPELVRKLSDRHFGIGGDGVIFINPSEIADFEMEMWNADGTRGEMCGNGIRCVGKFVYDKGMTDKTEITVESFGKIKVLTLYTDEYYAEESGKSKSSADKNSDNKESETFAEEKKAGRGTVSAVRVNMGAPVLEAADIPVRAEKSPVVSAPIQIPEKGEYRMTCVSMGNPHAVVYIEDTDNLDIEKTGPLFENNSVFPNRVNTEFVQIIDRSHVKMRVWERGSGETLACGTGCCAICVAGVLNNVTDPKIEVQVLGGKLEIEWDSEENIVWMTGPATTVFEGTVSV